MHTSAQANSDIISISVEINRLRLDYWLDHNVTPYETNNGWCDDFAQDVIEALNLPSDNLYCIGFLNLTNTGDDDWTDFYKESQACFDLSPTHNLNREDFIRALKDYADESHCWLVYQSKGVVRHFDAECPKGVLNPFMLPTFEKCIKAASMGLKGDELEQFYAKGKQSSELAFKDEYCLPKSEQ